MAVIPLGTANDFATSLGIPEVLLRRFAVVVITVWRPGNDWRCTCMYVYMPVMHLQVAS